MNGDEHTPRAKQSPPKAKQSPPKAKQSPPKAKQSWPNKFRVAASGCIWAFRTQSSFTIHLFVMVAVLITAVALPLEPWRWSATILAIGGVLTAEMFNTSIETLVEVLHPNEDHRIGRVLDAAAGAVLIAALASATVGFCTLGPPLWEAAFAP